MKSLPFEMYGPFDTGPSQNALGWRVGFVIDGALHYGRISRVSGRTVTIDLERRWGHRHRITMHWASLRLADDQASPPVVPPRPPLDPARVEMLRAAVAAAVPIPRDTLDRETLSTTVHALYQQLQEHLSALHAMRDRIHVLASDFTDARERASAAAIAPLPPAVESIRDIDLRFAKKPERKRHLSAIRSQTHALLEALLIAAGDDGVTSEEVTAVLCTSSPHRVMGMLSSFSRKKQAVLQPNGKWKAT